MMQTRRQWLQAARQLLKARFGSELETEAEQILAFCLCQGNLAALYAQLEKRLNKAEQGRLSELLKRRLLGEPMAYLLGGREEFWSLPFCVSHHTLIPRSASERLVEVILQILPKHLPAPAKLLELGVGSGALSLSIASERPDCKIIGIERSQAALAVAWKNQSLLGFKNVRFLRGDWWQLPWDFCLDGGYRTYDLIFSNPPYVDKNEVEADCSSLSFEPQEAIFSERSGFNDLEHLIQQARYGLKQGAALVLEHGFQQGEAVRKCFQAEGYSAVTTYRDYGNRERVTMGFYEQSI